MSILNWEEFVNEELFKFSNNEETSKEDVSSILNWMKTEYMNCEISKNGSLYDNNFDFLNINIITPDECIFNIEIHVDIEDFYHVSIKGKLNNKIPLVMQNLINVSTIKKELSNIKIFIKDTLKDHLNKS